MKLELIIPETLSEISLGNYQKYLERIEGLTDENECRKALLECICGVELKQGVSISAQSLIEVTDHILNIIQKGEPELKTTFEIQGTKFGFVPDLENISWGEYLDLDSNISDWSNMHKAMAVMYRPITKQKGDKWETEEYNGTANYSEVMRFAPLSVASSALVFFWNLEIELLKSSLKYLAKERDKMMSSLRRGSSHKNGGGTAQSVKLLEERLSYLIQSSNILLGKY